MENNDLVVPHNSRIGRTLSNNCSEAQTSPAPPKCSPVSSASLMSLTSRFKQDDSKMRRDVFEEIQREKSSCSSTEEKKEAGDILKNRLYDRAENSEVYRSLHTQPRLQPHPPQNAQPKQQSALYRATLLRKEKKRKKLATQSADPIKIDAIQVKSNENESLLAQPKANKKISPATKGDSPPPSPSGFGPDRFDGLDVIQVIQLLRKRLNWESDIEKIIEEEQENLWRDKRDFTLAGKTLRKTLYSTQDDGVFAYAKLKDLGNPIARYNPYNLVCVGAAETFNLKQIFFVTASSVTQSRENSDAELVSTSRWLYQRRMFFKIFKIPVFAKFRIWKAFTTWKNNVRAFTNRESRQTLHDTLTIVDDVLQIALLKIRFLCEEECGSLQHKPAKMFFVDEKFGENTLTLEQFKTECSRQADLVNIQLRALRATCLSITADACQNMIERHTGLLQWIKSQPGSSGGVAKIHFSLREFIHSNEWKQDVIG